MSDINRFLRVIEGENAAGDNLEYDDLYLQMEDLATNSEASLSSSEDLGQKSADYKSLLKVTSNLLERTRDLRVAVFHTIALTATQGFKGLKDGLTLLGFISVELWNEAYPQLDPDDDLDPTERLNILSTLSPTSVNDPFGFLNLVVNQHCCPPLPLTSRDIKVAKGIISSDEDTDVGLLKGQILSLPDQVYAEDYLQIQSCKEACESLESAINAQVTEGSLSLEKLKNELSFILRFFDEARGQPVQASDAPANTLSEDAPEQAATNLDIPAPLNVPIQAPLTPINPSTLNAATSGAPASGEMVPLSAYMQLQSQVQQLQSQLNQQMQLANARSDLSNFNIESRKDALALIEKCRAYFQKKEPTSPVPFLLQRALNMADMNFIQLLGEIDSSALERGREQLGVKSYDSDN